VSAGEARPRRDAGLYVHIPFCSAVCPYCDFAVTVGRPEKRRRYAETLLLEIDLAADFPAAFDTIYFGGGTPSLLAPEDLELLLGRLRTRLRFAGGPRIYLEANPEDVTGDSLEAWRRAGVATLSLGVQSFDASELAFLGRRHSPEASRRSVGLALAAGFETVSVDLIYGLPGQDPGSWRRTLELAVALGPHHLSCYELEIHRKTTFGKKLARGEIEELPEDARADLFLATHRFLNGAGWAGYEVSNFARGPEHRSRHNRKYWDHTPYLGLGVSAHSFDGERRFWNERSLPRYEAAIRAGRLARGGEEMLTEDERALEVLMLGLRTYAGIDLDRFERSYGVRLVEANEALIERYRTGGLVEVDRSHLRPTIRGLALADALAASLELKTTDRIS
jgi:oxygen-independent coproporphyrinogen-3 oxidase